jgi:hypothetical protein
VLTLPRPNRTFRPSQPFVCARRMPGSPDIPVGPSKRCPLLRTPSLLTSLVLVMACNGSDDSSSADDSASNLPDYDDADQDGIIDQHDGTTTSIRTASRT